MLSLLSLELLCRLTGVKRDSLRFRVLEAIYVRGLTRTETAEELGCHYVTAVQHLGWWRKNTCQRHEELMDALARDWERRQLEWALYRIGEEPQAEELSALAEARALLRCVRGRESTNPPTPTYDDNGRQVGSGCALIDEGLYADALGFRNVRRAQGLPGW